MMGARADGRAHQGDPETEFLQDASVPSPHRWPPGSNGWVFAWRDARLQLGAFDDLGRIFQGVHRATNIPAPPETQPKRVAVDATTVRINLDNKWVLGATHGTDPAAVLLHPRNTTGLRQYFCSIASASRLLFLDYFSRREYSDRTLLETWFQALRGSTASILRSRSSGRHWSSQLALITTASDRISR